MTSGRFTALTSILFKVKCQADKNYIQYSPHFLQYGHCICGNITFYWDNIQSKYSLIVIMASRNHIQYVSSTSTNHDLHNPTRTARTVSVQECSKEPHLTMNLLHPPWGWHEDAGMLCEARVCLAEWDGWVGGCGWVMWVHMEVFRVSKQQWNLHFPSSPETPLKKCQLLEGKRGVKQKPATYSHWHMQVYTNTSGHCLLSSVSWSDRILKRQLDGGVIIKGGGRINMLWHVTVIDTESVSSLHSWSSTHLTLTFTLYSLHLIQSTTLKKKTSCGVSLIITECNPVEIWHMRLISRMCNRYKPY